MIKFDKDVLRALQALERKGFETYAAGVCVRDQILGLKVYDWDLYTKATLSDMEEILERGEVYDREKQIFRIDFTYEIPAKEEGETPTIDGCIVDIRHYDGDLRDVLSGMGFTINAMADNPERSFADFFGGRNDLKSRLIKTVGDADTLFSKEPVRMMEAVRLAAELDFDLHKSVFDAIGSNWRTLMEQVDRGETTAVRREFEDLVTADFAGKGLKMLTGSGLMAVVLGEEIASKMSMSDTNAFKTVCENIDKTKPVKDRRLGLVYTALHKKRAIPAIERLHYNEKTKTHLIDGVEKHIDINFLNTDMEFKRFLHEYGMDRYMYLHNLAKAMRIVYDQPANKVEARNYMLKKVASEPVFAEDLVIDANDLMEAGIADTPERAEELLNLVVAVVHKNPLNNNRDVLLKQAGKMAKSKFAAKTRYVKWTR